MANIMTLKILGGSDVAVHKGQSLFPTFLHFFEKSSAKGYFKANDLVEMIRTVGVRLDISKDMKMLFFESLNGGYKELFTTFEKEGKIISS